MFFSIDEQTVIGILKMTNSKDPDVLATAAKGISAQAKLGKFMFWGLLSGGILISLTIIGVFVGIPMILIAFFINSRVKKMNKTIDAAYKRYLGQIGVQGE
ncbi:MAG: hypothetical protein K2Y12_09115 [Chitinophagaceae bacterium]|nr:hypothetical protein [Chitinophagaceae bacterium]